MTSLSCFTEQTEELCLEIVSKNPFEISYVQNKTYDICLTAVSKEPSTIRFIHNPSTDLCWIALKHDPALIKCIISPTLEMVEYALDASINYAIFIRDLSIANILRCSSCIVEYPEMSNNRIHVKKLKNYLITLEYDELLALIAKYPHLIAVIDTTREVIMIALESDPDTLAYVKEPDSIMIDLVLNKTRFALQYVPSNHPSYEDICLDSIRKWPGTIENVINPTYEMLQIAVKSCPQILEAHYSEELAWIALKANTKAVEYIDQATSEMIEYVLKTNPFDLLDYCGEIPDDLRFDAIKIVPDLVTTQKCDDLPDDLKWHVIKDAPDLVEYIVISDEMQNRIVDIHPHAVNFCGFKSDLIWRILRNDPDNIKHVNRFYLSREMIGYAVKKSPRVLQYLSPSYKLIDLALASHPNDISTVIESIPHPAIRQDYRQRFLR